MRQKEERKKMKTEMIDHIKRIDEFKTQFEFMFEDYDPKNITIPDILNCALYVKELFNEEGHFLYEAFRGSSVLKVGKGIIFIPPTPKAKKLYNQINYFIKKWSN